MYAWETLNHYCLYDRRWFESSSRYAPGSAHLAVFRALMPEGWQLRRRGLWYLADPPEAALAAQGWKLHVASPIDATVEVLRRTLPLLREAGVHFKFLVDPWANELTSGKSWPRASGGKFLTVYPEDAERFVPIADALAQALADMTGPYVLSDRRYRDSKVVHYRYGGFVGVPRIQADGSSMLMITAPDGALVPDVRQPYWQTPDWVEDPFDDERPDQRGGALGGRFHVHSALSFSNQGGVYRGRDAETGAEVVLKEARPHIVTGIARVPAIQVLEKEHRLLEALADTGRFVRPVAFLREWEHAFLVEEHVDGEQIGALSIATNPICNLELDAGALRGYFERMRGLWRQLAEAIAAAHERGILLGDLSFTNVLVVEPEDRVKLIDLEAAVEPGVDAELGIYTLGLSSRRTVETLRYDRANDYHALGALMLGTLMVVNNAIGFHRPALAWFLDALAADLALPPELVALIADLTDEDAAEPDAARVRERIDALDFAALWREPAPLALPAGAPDAGLRRRVQDTVAGIADYIVATADPGREDRLFPADLAVFETNPLSIAYGATGVLYALRRIAGRVPEHLLAWTLRHEVDSRAYPPGLYVGQSGIAWALAELVGPDLADGVLARAAEHPLLWEATNVMYGCAGYGLSRLRLWQLTGADAHLAEARRVGAHLAATAVRDERGARWPSREGLDPEERAQIGYAYGGSGVALFLLYLHLATGEEAAFELGRAALDFDLAARVRIGGRACGYPRQATEGPIEAGVVRNYWDEGTAGVTTVALRYAASRPDPRLRERVRADLEDSCRKYAVLPQLFHGLAGLGNVLLDAYELTGDRRYLDEAWRTAEGVLLFRVDRDEGVVFPGEQALRECTDFATGSAGIGLFLHRLTHACPGGRTNFNFVLDDLLPAGVVAWQP